MEEWGPWIEHDGSGCPVPFGSIAEITERANVGGNGWEEGDERTGVVVVISGKIEPWYRGKSLADIIRYRIRKPRGMVVLDALLQDLPQDAEA